MNCLCNIRVPIWLLFNFLLSSLQAPVNFLSKSCLVPIKFLLSSCWLPFEFLLVPMKLPIDILTHGHGFLKVYQSFWSSLKPIPLKLLMLYIENGCYFIQPPDNMSSLLSLSVYILLGRVAESAVSTHCYLTLFYNVSVL